MYDVLSQYVIHAQWLYTLRYNIKGSVATSRAMPTPFYLSIINLLSFGPSGFMYIYESNNSLVQPRKHHFKIQ